jgi:uncharacterized protein YeaO (DUF488 family)
MPRGVRKEINEKVKKLEADLATAKAELKEAYKVQLKQEKEIAKKEQKKLLEQEKKNQETLMKAIKKSGKSVDEIITLIKGNNTSAETASTEEE